MLCVCVCVCVWCVCDSLYRVTVSVTKLQGKRGGGELVLLCGKEMWGKDALSSINRDFLTCC